MVEKDRGRGRPRISENSSVKKVVLNQEHIDYIESLGFSTSEYVRKLVKESAGNEMELAKGREKHQLQIIFDKEESDFLTAMRRGSSAYIRELIYLDMEKNK
jgi:hypothetical protein